VIAGLAASFAFVRGESFVRGGPPDPPPL